MIKSKIISSKKSFIGGETIKKEIILIIALCIVLGSITAVTAHPGHGTAYPDEVVINDTSNQGSGQSSGGATSNSGDSSSSSSNSKSSDTSSNGDDNENSSISGDAQGVEEVLNTNDTTNATSQNSSNMPWDIISLIAIFGIGFGAVVGLSKLGILSK
jgi:hypothetical protein